MTGQGYESPRESVGRAASWAGAGMIPPHTERLTISPTVEGVKVVRPAVGPTTLPTTGTPFPVLLLVLLGLGLMGAGVVTTVAGEHGTAGATPRHRR